MLIQVDNDSRIDADMVQLMNLKTRKVQLVSGSWIKLAPDAMQQLLAYKAKPKQGGF